MARRDIIAIGGSLGSVDALKRLCSVLPGDLPAAVLIVVHIGAEGPNLLGEILNRESALTIGTAVAGEPLRHGHAYVAPADHHLLVLDGVIRLGHGPRENMARPALDPLFRSVGISHGPRAIGLVLTGLLNDGAAGLADLKRCGGVTVVQNPADAVASGMPLGALQASDVDYRAPLSDLGALLVELAGAEAGPPAPVADDIGIEVEIALGRPTDTAKTEKIARPVALSCPTCGGVLSEIRRGPPLRFRCQVGHAFTAEALARDSDGAIDEAIVLALRIIGERVVLSEKMAEDAYRSGHHAAALVSEKRAAECRRHVEILRKAIPRGQRQES